VNRGGRRLTVVAHNAAAALGGGETGTARLLAGLRQRGHRVEMLCRDEEMSARIAEYGVPTSVLRIRGDAVATDAVRFALALRRRRPDAVILTTFKRILLAGLGARMAGVPRVVQRIVLSSDTPRAFRYRFALRHFVDAVALNAEAMRPAFLAGDPHLDPARVVTLYDGVETPRRTGASGALRAELGIPADAPVVGAVARLVRQKRFNRLLKAAARLPNGVHVLIAGEGEERDRLRALAADLGLGGRLHLPGFRDDVGDVLDAIDVFAVTSDREGMANAMLEAMACGVPCASTEVSGAREALQPGADGVAPGEVVAHSVDAIAGAVAALLADPGRRAAMGRAGQRRVAERFSFPRMLDAWERLLSGSSLPEGGR
jgi:glycosyltransferase involved in cell wall biosynthesis